jgi:hypothetical protein
MKDIAPWFALILVPLLPVASACVTCEEEVGTETGLFSLRGVGAGQERAERGPNGSFVAAGQRYLSCNDFCERSGAFISLESCEESERGDLFQVSCTGVTASCRSEQFNISGSGRYLTGVARPQSLPRDVRSYLEQMLHGERAAVVAFRQLRSEMHKYGASQRILDACTRAIGDEVRHARLFETMLGAQHERSLPPREACRSLETVLVENIVEGCFSETLGALVLAVQAMRAEAPKIRAAAGALWRDEARHAETSVLIAQFFQKEMLASPLARATLQHILERHVPYPFASMTPRERAQIGTPSEAEYTQMAKRVQGSVILPLLHGLSVAA